MTDLVKTIPLLSKGKSITEVLPSVFKLLSIEIDDKRRSVLGSEIYDSLKRKFEGAKRIIIFQIDGLGYDRVSQLKNKLPFEKDSIFKIYTTFPTYTLPAFASFVTGISPSYHGIVAGSFKISGQVKWTGEMKNDKDMILEDSLLWELEKKGKKCYSVVYDQHNDFYNGKLYPNRFFVPSVVSCESLVEEAKIIEERVLDQIYKLTEEKFFLMTSYFYYLDALTGKYGKFSPEALNHCLNLFKNIVELSKKFPKKSSFMIIGDHGHTSLKKNVILDSKVMQNIFSQTGSEMALDGRMLMFYSGNLKLIKKLFEKEYGRYVEEVGRKDYLNLLGGEYNPKILERIGDLIYTAKPHFTLRTKPKESKATHGGISNQEFETALICWRN